MITIQIFQNNHQINNVKRKKFEFFFFFFFELCFENDENNK